MAATMPEAAVSALSSNPGVAHLPSTKLVLHLQQMFCTTNIVLHLQRWFRKGRASVEFPP
jgi:hypothetical protein